MRNIKDFGQYIAKNRKKAGMTQEAFAMQLGITPQAVSKWENGIGYPDVSLFPAIAQALGISIESLFVENTDHAESFPKTYQGLPFVFGNGERACYSAKTVVRVAAAAAYFEDGSTADLTEALVHNRGMGEIVFLDHDAVPPHTDAFRPAEYTEPLDAFSSLEVLIAHPCHVRILHAADTAARAHALGSQCFIGALRMRTHENILTVTVNNHTHHDITDENNRLDIYIGNNSTDRLKIHIEGSSSCHVSPAFDKAELIVSGSGNIALESARHATVSIKGCGNVVLPHLTASLDMDIRGSGAVTAAGDIDTLRCDMQSGGMLDGKQLTVGEAEIYTLAAAQIHIGRIKRASTEKLGKGTRLYVTQRG